MKHQCKTMVEVQEGIKEFNEGVRNITTLVDLSLRLYDSVPIGKRFKKIDPLDGKGILSDVLVYGKKKKEATCVGYGMRFLYCPFCGEKL